MIGASMEIRLKLKYVHKDKDRHGKTRIYFQRPKGPKIRLKDEPGSEAFLAAYRKALVADAAKTPKAKPTFQPGTLSWLRTQYVASHEFKALDPSTQYVRRGILDSCLQEPITPEATAIFADFPLARLTAKAIKVLRDRKAGKPGAARNRVRTLSAMFAWAVENDHMDSNPALGVKRPRKGGDGFHAWTLEELEAFEAKHPVGTTARLAFALLLYTGQRRGDVVTIGPQHVKDGWLTLTQAKTGTALQLPILAELQEIINASTIGLKAYLVTSHGKPFTPAGFGNKFREWCNDAGLPQCSAHGLRKAGASRAAENGATEDQLKAIFGWKTSSEAARYTKSARQKTLAGHAMKLLQKAETGTKGDGISPTENLSHADGGNKTGKSASKTKGEF